MTTDTEAKPFEWQGEPVNTIGELLDAAFEAERDGNALAFLNAYREVNPHADVNLSYVIGYVEPAQRRGEMYEAFGLNHPVLGGRP